MYTDKQLERILGKLKNFNDRLELRIFEKVASLEAEMYPTATRYDAIPDLSLFTPAQPGTRWGGEWMYCWFHTKWEIPAELDGRTLFLKPNAGGQEAMLFVNGIPFGVFNRAWQGQPHATHYCDMLVKQAQAGEVLDIGLECYAWHYSPGSAPLRRTPESDFMFTYQGLDVCMKNEQIADFYFDLKTFLQMADCLDANSFVRAHIVNTLLRVHELLYYSPDDTTQENFMEALSAAGRELKALYAHKNTDLAPIAAVIGHSHMDTAWQWPIDETIKKCARTYSNQISLMEQYPEYKFVQSSAYHSYMMKEHYPALYERMKAAIAAGRYEPNGGVWVECDCNIVGGEWMARQFVWGQRYTQQEFGYTSNAFWLPDTFGYSAAIPQIMKACGVDYFLTTKIAWNDTTTFPYDTFWWRGIDGTQVLAHFNKTHIWPDPETCIDHVSNGWRSKDCVKEKNVSPMRLLAYGHGDGGGGPLFEMIEMARRCADIEGCPKVQTMTVGEFMQRLEASLVNPSTYSGELYLELHRGTLTNQHQIKRNNRLAEAALHDAEYMTVRRAQLDDAAVDGEALWPLVNTLLVNQFHDILPGTCIHVVHERSLKETEQLIFDARAMTDALARAEADDQALTLINTLSFPRQDVVYLDAEGGYIAGDYPQQIFTALDGRETLAVSGVKLDAFASLTLTRTQQQPCQTSPFTLCGNRLETPFYHVTFSPKMGIAKLFDKRVQREVQGSGLPLNTFLLGEDLPLAWDNWDIDADLECKMRDVAELMETTCISDGAVEWRMRSRYRLTDKSTLCQDMIFYADDPQIRFETVVDWQDDHRLLKVAFDTSIHSDQARQEIQFGHVKRPTTRNTAEEKAKFEVCNHRFTDLSEPRYGVALLNDCKYGVSVKDGCISLTLHKGGCRPDEMGDHGRHCFTYALLPHVGDFSAENTIRPAYCLNMPAHQLKGRMETLASLMTVDIPNVIVETVKPLEDGGHGYAVRLYEAEGCTSRATVSFGHALNGISETNMLEEEMRAIPVFDQSITLNFRPFEIKTLKVLY